MKTVICLLVLISMACMTSPSLHAAPFLAGALARSPDHPSTWVNGADNIHQALRWDAGKHMFFADVKYSTVLYADDTHPTQENDYALSFPTVKFDPASGIFTANGVKVGTLHHGFFGAIVVLDRGVELNIHRHNGRIFAAISPGERDVAEGKEKGPAGAGTSGGSQAVGGPGHGPEGAMNGISQ